MRVRFIAACALGVALAASESAAQDTTRARTTSERRISVAKGEVALPPRVDTVYVTRSDTVVVRQQAEPITLVRVDTVLVPAPILEKIRRPVYWGFYTGATMPYGNIDRLYTNGFHAGVLAGWDGDNQLLGLRLSGDLAQINREQGVNPAVIGTTTPLMFTFGGDLKFMPFRATGFQLYAVGGGNLNVFKGIATVSEEGTGVTGVDGKGGWYTPVEGSNWTTKFGFNAGGGADFRVFGQDLFLEARAMAIQANGARSWYIPISFGLRYF